MAGSDAHSYAVCVESLQNRLLKLYVCALDALQHAGEEYLYNAQASLLRASLMKHDLIQRPAIVNKKGLGFHGAQFPVCGSASVVGSGLCTPKGVM